MTDEKPGMTLYPGVEYTREIKRPEYLTLAALDCRPQMNRGETNLTAYLVLKCDNYEHVLCTLVQGRVHQQILNFVMQEGEKMTLTVEGSGIVHVTGYTFKQLVLSDDTDTRTETTLMREVSDGIQDGEVLSPLPSSEGDDCTIIDEDFISEVKYETLGRCDLEAVDTEGGPDEQFMGESALLSDVVRDGTGGTDPEGAAMNMDTDDYRHSAENNCVSNDLLEVSSSCRLHEKDKLESRPDQQIMSRNSLLTRNETEDTIDSNDTPDAPPESSVTNMTINDHRCSNRENSITNNDLMQDTCNYALHIKEETEQISNQHANCKNAILRSNQTEATFDSDVSTHATSESSTLNRGANIHRQPPNREVSVSNNNIMENTTNYTSHFELKQEQESDHHLTNMHASFTSNETVDSDESTHETAELSAMNMDINDCRGLNRKDTACADGITDVMESTTDYTSHFVVKREQATEQCLTSTNAIMTSSQAEGAVDFDENTLATAESSTKNTNTNDYKGPNREDTVPAESVKENTTDYTSEFEKEREQTSGQHMTSTNPLMNSNEIEGTVDSDKSTPATADFSTINIDTSDYKGPNKEGTVPADIVMENITDCTSDFEEEREQSSGQVVATTDKIITSNGTEGTVDSNECSSATAESSASKMGTNHHSQSPDFKGEGASMQQTLSAETILEGSNDSITQGEVAHHQKESSHTSCKLLGKNVNNAVDSEATENEDVLLDRSPCQAHWKTKRCIVQLERIDKLFSSYADGHPDGTSFLILQFNGEKVTVKDDLAVNERNHTPKQAITSQSSVRMCYGRTLFKCQLCLKTFSTMRSLTRPHTCKCCDEKFRWRSTLETHEGRHTGENPMTCEHCNKTFSCKLNLQAHKRIHNVEKRFTCKFCDKKFRTREYLKVHARIHTGEKPFTCSHCNQKFRQRGSLKFHEMIHTRGKPFKCGYCDRKFSRNKDLKEHERNHTGEMPYTCNHCDRKFSRKATLHEHEKIHTGKKPFTCDHCGIKFYHKSGLIRHKRVHTGEKPFACKFCNKKFSQKSYLTRHERIHTDEKPYSCEHCGKKFRWRRTLLFHESVRTGVNHSRGEHCCNEISQKANLSDNENSDEKPFRCGYCYKRFSQLSHLMEHERVHCSEKPFTCKYCNKKFIHEGSLKMHERIHTDAEDFTREKGNEKFSEEDHLQEHGRVHNSEKLFTCKHCKEKFSQKDHLQLHERSHAGEKLFTCTHCKEKFSQKDYLQEHERVHSGEKTFACEHCDKKFSQKDHLQVHERSHTGDKLFTCEHCNEKFSQKDHLQAHERSHTGDKLFTCKHCDKKFNQKEHLQVHKRAHPQEEHFTCKLCSKKFSHESVLKLHEKIHAWEKPFKCERCSRRFSQKISLEMHESYHTGVKPSACKQ